MCVKEGKIPRLKAEKEAAQRSRDLILQAFEAAGGDASAEMPENIAVFKFWLKQNGQYWIDEQSKTFDSIIKDCCLDAFDIAAVEKASNCEACRYNEPGQNAHMCEGGCLYDADY